MTELFVSLHRLPRITGNAEERPANVGGSGSGRACFGGLVVRRPLFNAALAACFLLIKVLFTHLNDDSKQKLAHVIIETKQAPAGANKTSSTY